jgi:tetratricopeptide (TPR) repeat protein
MRELIAKAGDAYAEGLNLFPDDVRLQFKLAQVFDQLGLWEQAEGVFLSALRADPNLAEIYARYGLHLFLHRKLLRAEAYYRRAMNFSDNDIAIAGLQDIALLRARSRDQKYVDQFGDPLEDFDMEPPTAEDEKRGAILHE